MVIENLSEKMQADGRVFLHELDCAGLGVKSAFWMLFPEAGQWRFVVATPNADALGPKKVYQQIQRVLNRKGGEFDSISLSLVSLFSSKHGLIQVLASAVNTGHSDTGIRFSRNTINGTYIEDAYIYRSTK